MNDNEEKIKCPICGKEVSELDDKCPYCGLYFDDFEEQKIDNMEDTTNKIILLKIINYIQLIGFIILGIINFNSENILLGIIYIVIGLVLFAFIKGFSDIIDLLDSINNKIQS